MATINIGKIKPRHLGAWNNSTTYKELDIVELYGSSYMAIADGSNKIPNTSSTYWELMSEKGDTGDTGETGRQGVQGVQGPAGNDGISITDIAVNASGELIVTTT